MINKEEDKLTAWTDSAVKSLVDAKSFDILCHKHRTGESMPSAEKLRVIVEKNQADSISRLFRGDQSKVGDTTLLHGCAD